MATGVVVVVVAQLVYSISRPQGWFLHIEFAASRDYTRTIWWPINLGLQAMGIQVSNKMIGLLATAAFIVVTVGLVALGVVVMTRPAAVLPATEDVGPSVG
ncbi:MAG TPA: hypothetical protein EYP73_06505 [Acidimicrobiia bacterium]|nr:hypothetical protein [Acidimicrobiia bacterium]